MEKRNEGRAKPTDDCVLMDRRAIGEQMQEGLKFDSEKLRFDLLPVDALREITKVLNFGLGKYGERNWERGMNWARLYRAAVGHMFDWFESNELDNESNLLHLAHAGCCILFLISYAKRNVGHDDRPKDHARDE